LDEAIRRNRDRADDFLAVLDTATRNDHLDLADRAAALIAKHGGTATAPKPAANPSPTPSPMPWTAPELPGPIEDVAELLSELASALRSDSDDLVAWERVVAGLAQLSVRRPDELRRALRTIVEPSRVDAAPFGVDWWQVEQLTRLARDLAYERAMRPRFWDFVRGGSRDATVDELRPRLLAGSGPQRVIVARLQELTLTVGTPAAEWPLATPTRVNGHLDLSVLVERLEALQACGAEPGPIDLEQALLRLPRELDHDAAARARRLSSPAGRTLVDWLDGGGLADPVMTTFTTTRGPSWTSQPAPDRRLVGIAAAPSDSGPVVQALLGARPGTGHTSDDLAFLFNRGWWPAVLPSHREVIAAYLLPGIADTAEFDQRGGARALPRLAETTGPTGPATALCLAYGLGARHADDRIATVDAAVQFAATGQLPAAVVGGQLGELCVNGNVKLTRAVVSLDEIVRAGAAGAAWLTIEAALPALLAAADRPRGLPDLLQLGARVAVPGPVPDALTDLVERGTGRLGTEAKRLRGVLAG
jgi:hypothetical protein